MIWNSGIQSLRSFLQKRNILMIFLFKCGFDLRASRSLFLESNWVDDELVDKLLGLSLFKSSSFFFLRIHRVLWMFFVFEACVLKFFGAFGLESNESLIDQSSWTFWRLWSLIPVELWNLEEWFELIVFVFFFFFFF